MTPCHTHIIIIWSQTWFIYGKLWNIYSKTPVLQIYTYRYIVVCLGAISVLIYLWQPSEIPWWSKTKRTSQLSESRGCRNVSFWFDSFDSISVIIVQAVGVWLNWLSNLAISQNCIVGPILSKFLKLIIKKTYSKVILFWKTLMSTLIKPWVLKTLIHRNKSSIHCGRYTSLLQHRPTVAWPVSVLSSTFMC